MNEIEALRKADFDWIYGLDDVWTEPASDVPDLHSELRSEFASKLDEMERSRGGRSPLGWVMVGDGGTGKTHLLGAFRREAARRKHPFIMVDLTDARNFWANVLQGYVDSLQQEVGEGMPQYRWILGNIIERFGPSKPVADVLRVLAERKTTDLLGDINKILTAMRKAWPDKTMKHQNIIRAIICINSDDFSTSNQGQTWLQGQALEPEEKRLYGFTTERETPKSIVEALSWFLSLSGPAVLAFDQLDPIVAELNSKRQGGPLAEETAMAEGIIAEIGGGLGALRDVTTSTLTIVSCYEPTWRILGCNFLRSSLDRFEEPRRLNVLRTPQVAGAMAAGRLIPAFSSAGIPHPFPTYPFRPEAFHSLVTNSPRELLMACDRHVKKCIKAGKIYVLKGFGAPAGADEIPTSTQPASDRLDREFASLHAQADPAWILDEEHDDDRLAPLLRSGLACLVHESGEPDDVDATIDARFTGGAKTAPLHARLRRIFRKENDREDHYCVRGIQHSNAKAYQNRLTAALTTSGIDRRLKFRRLAIVRSIPAPGGAKSAELTEQFESLGGVFVEPAADDLRALHALHALRGRNDPEFLAWLRDRKPASGLGLIRGIVGPEFDVPAAVPTPEAEALPPPAAIPPASLVPMPSTNGNGVAKPMASPTATPAAPTAEPFIPVGRRLTGGATHGPVTLPVRLLPRHTLVMAGAGSGKTMFLRRLVEEAALVGIPSIVVDCANDLATLGDRWEAPPSKWDDGDAEKADRYHVPGRVVVWTPNRADGNPLWFEPLPNLAALVDDPEALTDVVAAACEALVPIVAKGRSQASDAKRGILSGTLRYMASRGGRGMEDLIEVLGDLPPEAGLGVSKAAKYAAEMADALRIAREVDPMMRSRGTPFDPAFLFGPSSPDSPARVSVISLVGLGPLEAQRAFLNQLAMTLFSWIKKNPDPGGRPLRGLLVIDEAKDFIPSQQASTCRESLLRLGAQARKYHLGLVFATQNPKDIDNRLTSNCSTHVYGKMNSPAAIATVQGLIREKGGSGDDVSRLSAGRFYVHNAEAGMGAPIRIDVPYSLSRHPANPLDEPAVIARAAASRPG